MTFLTRLSFMFSRNAFLVYILLLCLFTFVLSRYPGHNGDMPFYIACAIEKGQGSMNGVVDQTKEVLKKELPAAEYQDHAARFGNSDPVILERYRIKPLYILLVLIFHRLGFSYIHATVIPSLIGYFLIGLSIWRFAIQRLDSVMTFLISMVCMMIYPTLVLARLSTPDAISCFFMLNALLFIYFGRNKTLWICLFLVAICARVDNVVSELIFLFALWKWPGINFSNKLSTKEFISFSSILIGVALLVNGMSARHFFWFTDPYFSQPAGQYVKDVRLYFFVVAGSFFMSLFILFLISGFSRGFSRKSEVNYLFYVVCVLVFVRFLLYPYYEERYLMAFYLFSLLIFSFHTEELKKEGINGLDNGGNSHLPEAEP
jgi:hypothetical protein